MLIRRKKKKGTISKHDKLMQKNISKKKNQRKRRKNKYIGMSIGKEEKNINIYYKETRTKIYQTK